MSELTNVVEGVIEAVSVKERGWAVKIGGEWYNSLDGVPPKRGDGLSGSFVVNKGKYRDLEEYAVSSQEKKSDFPREDLNKAIQRQACLKVAATLMASLIPGKDWKLNDIELMTMQLAEKFMIYVDKGLADFTGGGL